MKRMTRKIGLFGGPAALMSPMGAKKSVPAGAAPKADPGSASAPDAAPEQRPARRGWFLRLLLGDDDGN